MCFPHRQLLRHLPQLAIAPLPRHRPHPLHPHLPLLHLQASLEPEMLPSLSPSVTINSSQAAFDSCCITHFLPPGVPQTDHAYPAGRKLSQVFSQASGNAPGGTVSTMTSGTLNVSQHHHQHHPSPLLTSVQPNKFLVPSVPAVFSAATTALHMCTHHAPTSMT